ncbi:MAG: hypothetical protein AAF762_01980 [Pseudomonadota bacterium]
MWRAVGLLVILAVAGCAGPAEPVWAPDDAVKRARYVHNGPPTLTLFTVVTTRSGSGAHAALMVNADERLIFDPAGTFDVSFVPERNDVLFGITPRALAAYIDYHARPSHDVVMQEVAVTPAQARRVAALIKSHGAVPKAQCALSIGSILQDVDGFQDVSRSYFPLTLSESFGARPGVTTQTVTDATADTSHNVTFVRPGLGL